LCCFYIKRASNVSIQPADTAKFHGIFKTMKFFCRINENQGGGAIRAKMLAKIEFVKGVKKAPKWQ
jgi:hypothetical protein